MSDGFPIEDKSAPDWRFRITETSNNAYLVEGRDRNGRSVSRQGNDDEALLKECVKDAIELSRRTKDSN